MEKYQDRKVTKTIAVLYSIIMAVVFSQVLWAAPKIEQSKAKGGDCASCHVKEKILPEKHIDTKAMNREACKECHTKAL